MDPLVSVVVPSYNVEKYLGECVESVLNQTYSNWEMIIVNDGSQDNTLECAQKYADEDQRITVINQKNGGVSAARNAGLFAAKGKYIVFLDGDDYWRPEFLAKLTEAIERSGKKIAYCGYNRLYSNGWIRTYRYKYPSGDILIPPKNEPVQLHIGAMMFDRFFLNEHNISFTVGGLIGQDWEMMCKAVALTEVQSVPENLMIYRQRSGSALHSGWNWEKQIHSLKGRQRAIDFIKQKKNEVANYTEKLTYLKKRLAYKSLRFLWRLLKTGNYDKAIELMQDETFSKYLSHLDVKALGLIDMLKYHIIVSKRKSLWMIPKFFK
jgi:glycosyltransferase involved in cell wall biosynthesis